MAISLDRIIRDYDTGTYIIPAEIKDKNETLIQKLVENAGMPVSERGAIDCNEGVLCFLSHEKAMDMYDHIDQDVLKARGIQSREDFLYYLSVRSLLSCGYDKSYIKDLLGENAYGEGQLYQFDDWFLVEANSNGFIIGETASAGTVLIDSKGKINANIETVSQDAFGL